MKTIFGLPGLALVILLSGCSSPQSVSQMEGKGTKQVYDAGYDRVWSAAVAAAQQGDLFILEADKSRGYISAHRGLRPETFGENVAIWVRKVAPGQIEVEVVSRQVGPPVLVVRNWERRILTAIAANLTT